MRRDDPGLDAGRAWGARQATVVGGAEWRPGVPVLLPEPHRGVLTSGAADQLAALAARAAHAPVGLIHFVQGGRLRLYGGWGLSGSWDAVADAPAEESLAGLVLSSDAPVLVTDVASDDRVPPAAPLRRLERVRAYLGHPVRDQHGAVLGICCVCDHNPRDWTGDEVA